MHPWQGSPSDTQMRQASVNIKRGKSNGSPSREGAWKPVREPGNLVSISSGGHVLSQKSGQKIKSPELVPLVVMAAEYAEELPGACRPTTGGYTYHRCQSEKILFVLLSG